VKRAAEMAKGFPMSWNRLLSLGMRTCDLETRGLGMSHRGLSLFGTQGELAYTEGRTDEKNGERARRSSAYLRGRG